MIAAMRLPGSLLLLLLLATACGPDPGVLVARLRDGSPEERRQAAEALGERGDGTAVGALCAALGDAERAVRIEAARALGRIATEEGIGCLARALGERDVYTRLTAVEALAAIGRAAAGAMLEALPRSRGIVRNALAAAVGRVDDPRAVEPLRALLQRADGAEDGAARGLVALGHADLLVPFLAEPPGSPRRRAAARGLASARDRASLAALERALVRRDGGLDREVALALVRRNRLAPLITVLDAPARAAARRTAAEAIATSPHPRAGLALDRALERRDLAAVAGAHVRLIRTGREENEGLLVAALAAGGDGTMARRFVECGNPRLRAAGVAWLQAHGREDAVGGPATSLVILPGGAPRQPDVVWGRP